MRSMTRVYFVDEHGRRFFGEGPYRLLTAVEKTGSLRAAAASMDMAYTKALRLLRDAEAVLGIPLTVRTIGGKGGGCTQLTGQGKAWLARYAAYRDACEDAAQALYRAYYPDPQAGEGLQ